MNARDPLQELEDALSFEISPDFTARVRQQVAAQPPQSHGFGVRGLALAAVVLLAIGIGGLLALRSPEVQVAEAESSLSDRGARSAEALGQAEAGDRHKTVQASAPRQAARGMPNATSASFATLVPDDQMRALDYLLAAMREGRATVPPTMVEEEINDSGQRVLKALVIEPMKLEPLAGAPGETTKDPVKDPIK